MTGTRGGNADSRRKRRHSLQARRGYFYTFTALLFISILMFYLYGNRELASQHLLSEQTRVRTANDFITDLHADLDRAAYISGFRALIALEQHAVQTGDYLTEVDQLFADAFYLGEVANATYEVLENSSFSEYLQNVNHEARRVGITLNITVDDVALYHISPWEVAVDYHATVVINDTRGEASWAYDRTFSTNIPIYDLRDPLYSVKTLGTVPNTIRRLNNLTEFVDDTGDKNDTTVLALFTEGSYYVANPAAPSFVMRMKGNMSASPYGIESMVNPEDLDAQGRPVYSTRSLVDYVYFNQMNSADWCDVQNMPEHFRLDDAHLSFYEVDTDLEYVACP